MWVRRSDWERVTEREELVGRLRVASRLPQYLEGAVSHVSGVCSLMWVWKISWGYGLDDGDVDRRSRAGTVDLLLIHGDRHADGPNSN